MLLQQYTRRNKIKEEERKKVEKKEKNETKKGAVNHELKLPEL